MGDYRYLYLLQLHKDGVVRLVMAVKVYGALSKEQELHDKFSCSRFTIKSRRPGFTWGQAVCKIGIATNVKNRVRTINDDLTSGKTEWFLLTPMEVGFVLGWMRFYKLRPYLNLAFTLLTAILFMICYLIEKAPHLLR